MRLTRFIPIPEDDTAPPTRNLPAHALPQRRVKCGALHMERRPRRCVGSRTIDVARSRNTRPTTRPLSTFWRSRPHPAGEKHTPACLPPPMRHPSTSYATAPLAQQATSAKAAPRSVSHHLVADTPHRLQMLRPTRVLLEFTAKVRKMNLQKMRVW